MSASFWTAISFLTILPAPRGTSVPPVERIGGTLAWYPLVGLLLGLALSAAAIPLFRLLPPLPAGVLLTVLWAVATGGLHLDGVADACDALFSSRSRARALEIMKDPHIGVMGAIGLFGILAAKATLLASLGSVSFRALPAACLLARWAIVLAAASSRYARPEGGIASGIIQPSLRRILLASFWLPPAVLVSLPGLPPRAFLAAALAAACAAFIARAVFTRRLGGLTGDCLGAIGETSEVVVLAVFAARLP